MKRILFLVYGLIAYGISMFTLVYAMGFVAGVGVPKSIDSAPSAPLGTALLIDTILLAVFAVQHSAMARQGFKRVWTKIVPQAIERSTFSLAASAALVLLFWKWEPIGGVIWNADGEALRMVLRAISFAGWMFVLLSTFVIDHLDLFGVRQVWLYFRGVPYAPPQFTVRGWYAYVRHPIYFGFIVAFWATPTMTAAHLVFAIATTAHTLIAIQLEERDMVKLFGERYETYREQVSMLVPRSPKKARGANAIRG